MALNRPTHFEIPVDDPRRAEKFYGDVFGWTFRPFPGAPAYYGLALTGEGAGIDGALMQRDGGNAMTLTIDVASIEDAVASIIASGGKVVQAKSPIPGVGWFANCIDTEGNAFGVFVNDPSASM
jgi:predicted enzyme related to lactoylglutathione lyase